VSADTTQFGKLFHTLTTLLVKQYFLKTYLDRLLCNLKSFPLVI